MIGDMDNDQEHNWNTSPFTIMKLFDNQVMRSAYLTTVKQSAKVGECQARVEFLQKCQELNIIPSKCLVKPKVSGMFSQDQIKRQINQAKMDSRRELATSIKDSSIKFTFEDSKLTCLRFDLYDTLPAGWKSEVETILSVKFVAHLKSHKQSFHKTLKHLESKSQQISPVPEEQQPSLQVDVQFNHYNEETLTNQQQSNSSEFLIPSISVIPPTPQKVNKTRRHIKRTKFRKSQIKKHAQNFSNNLTTNLSSFPFEGTAKERVLNKGLNFCPVRKR